MLEENKTDQNIEQANNGRDNGIPSYLQGVFIVGAWVFIGLLLVAKFWPNLPQRMAFFTGNLFNLMIAFAVIAQVIIYRKQWRIMERQFVHAERAYVGIHSIEQLQFPDDKTLVLKIENTGRLPADWVGVKIDMIMLTPDSIVQKYGDKLKAVSAATWWTSYLRTKLFR